MGKVISFRRPPAKSSPRAAGDICTTCGHKSNVHIRHPNGAVSCAARGCKCEMRPRP